MIKQVSKKELQSVWETVRPLLLAALDETMGEQALGDVRRQIRKGEAQLHVFDDPNLGITAAFVTEVRRYPQKSSVNIWLCGGHDADRWASDFLRLAQAHCRAIGADFVEWTGRRGWEKVLAKSGARAQSVRMILEA